MDAPQPEQVIALDPRKHRTYHYWHVFIPGVKAGPAPGDICKEIEAVPVEEPTYLAQPRSVILLFSTLNQSGSGTIHSEGLGRKSP
jgi:hypothetical protein